MTDLCNVLVGKPEGKNTFATRRHRLMDVEMYLKKEDLWLCTYTTHSEGGPVVLCC